MISFITLDVLRKTSFMTCIRQCTVSVLGQVLARGICPLVLVDWMRWRCSAPTAWMLSLKIVNHGFNQLTRNDKHLSFKEERKTSEVCCSSFSRCYKFRQMLLQREEFDLRHDTVRKRLHRRVLGAWWRPVVLVRDSSWTILGSTCFDIKILRLTFLLQALCKRSVVTFVGYALLRVGRTPLRKTPVGLTADLFSDPSFDQQPWEAVSHFNLVFLLGIAP